MPRVLSLARALRLLGFSFQVVGQNVLTYEQALVAVFLEGWIFIVLSLTGVRGAVMKYMPTSIAFSGSVGMGLLLAYTGLRSLGVIAFDGTTLTTLGGCSGQNVQYVYYSNVSLANLTASVSSNLTSVETTEEFPVLATDMEGNVNDTMLNFSSLLFEQSSRTVFGCNGGEMRSATMWLGIAGGILSSLLLVWRVKGALFWGVLFVTVISWIPGHGASYLGAGSSIPGGQYRLENFEHVVAVPTLSSSGLKWDWSAIGNGHFWFVLFTFLYIDVLDCTGILLSMALLLDTSLEMDYYGVLDHEEIKAKKEAIKEANNGIEPNPYQQFVTTHSKEFKGQQWAFLSDGIGIVVSSMVGISPVSVYLESAAGIEEGGRTGIVPLVVSFFFFIALFFSPILSSIPSYATGSALMLVGIMLMAHADHIPWDDPKESIPAFITIMIMPLTYSVAYGILAGLCMYIILRLPEWVLELFRRARHKLREFRGEPSTDDNVSIASSKKSRGRGHAPRKVFGNLSNRGSDSYSNLGVSTDVFGRDRLTTGVSEVIPIPGGSRQLAHSQSHAAFSPSWDMRFGGLRGVGSSSPGGGSLLAGEESPSTVRRSWGRTMSGTEAMPMPVPPRSRPTGMQFPALRSSLKKSASFAVLDQSENLGTSDASMDGEAGGLFNNFQMLDLDLGGSGSSEDEDEIMVKNDGTLGLVSRKSLQLQRQSADMTMFNSSREGTNDMEPIAEPPDVGQVAHVSDSNEGSMHAARRITFSMLEKQGHDNEATLGAVDATAPQNTVSRTASLSRQATNQSMGSNTSAASSSGLGGLSRSLTQSASFPASRGMVRTESAAALRLKDLFAAAQANDDSGSSDE